MEIFKAVGQYTLQYFGISAQFNGSGGSYSSVCVFFFYFPNWMVKFSGWELIFLNTCVDFPNRVRHFRGVGIPVLIFPIEWEILRGWEFAFLNALVDLLNSM